MEFKQLEAFVSIVKNKSFSKAAEELFLTQPTVSQSISTLENELGVVLFDRTAKETRPTKEGRAFYSYALSMLNTRDSAISRMNQMENDISGVLEIRTSSIPGTYIIPEFVAGFHKLYPRVRFNIEQLDTEKVWHDILDGIGEIGFTGAFAKNRLKYVPILKDSIAIITPDNDKFRAILKERNKLRPEDIIGESFISREEGSATWEYFSKVMKEKSTEDGELDIAASVNSLEQVISLVRAGVGVSVLSEIALDSMPEGLLSFEFDEAIPVREFYMVYNKDISLSPVAKKFKEYIEAQI